MKKTIILLLALSLLGACKTKHWTVSHVKASVIQIDSTKDAAANKELLAFYKPYADSLGNQTSVVIGQAAKTLTMDRTVHENPLANFISDALRARADEILTQGTPTLSGGFEGRVDFALVNFGGIRASLRQGDITVGNIYEILPFENSMVILGLKGSDLRDLVNVFAANGGQGVSGMTLGIENKKPVNVLVNGEPIDDNREYIIATVDYLALGGDNMTPLLNARQILSSGIQIRDLVIDSIKRAAERGESIDANLDGRVYLVNH